MAHDTAGVVLQDDKYRLAAYHVLLLAPSLPGPRRGRGNPWSVCRSCFFAGASTSFVQAHQSSSIIHHPPPSWYCITWADNSLPSWTQTHTLHSCSLFSACLVSLGIMARTFLSRLGRLWTTRKQRSISERRRIASWSTGQRPDRLGDPEASVDRNPQGPLLLDGYVRSQLRAQASLQACGPAMVADYPVQGYWVARPAARNQEPVHHGGQKAQKAAPDWADCSGTGVKNWPPPRANVGKDAHGPASQTLVPRCHPMEVGINPSRTTIETPLHMHLLRACPPGHCPERKRYAMPVNFSSCPWPGCRYRDCQIRRLD